MGNTYTYDVQIFIKKAELHIRHINYKIIKVELSVTYSFVLRKYLYRNPLGHYNVISIRERKASSQSLLICALKQGRNSSM